MSDQVLDFCFGAYKHTVDAIAGSGKNTVDLAKGVFNKTKSIYDKSVKVLSDEDLSNLYEDQNLGSESGCNVFSSVGNHLWARRGLLLVGAGLASAGFLLYSSTHYLMNALPTHLTDDNQVLFVLGDIRDPVVRNQVNELYRRRFIVFVCKRKLKYGTGEPEDDFTIDDLTSEDGGIFFIDSDSSGLASFINYMNEHPEKQLRSILFMPNLSYYPSGTTLSSKLVASEVQENILNYFGVLEKLIPHFAGNAFKKLQLIFFNPSLSKNLQLKHHSVEHLVSGLITTFYETMKIEYSHKCDVYMCHIGILGIGGNASTFKYLSVRGSNISQSLCEPVYQLILSRDYLWLRLRRWLNGSVLYCGKGSALTSWLGYLCPLWLLDLF
ncbi:unnamed protein product [Kluyveromyces dobzhanskii CBS 2104]|uniref:WGS project CCBQ000000000 data, contig 00107 n=1 Tax=Kluyveromyces dobzhanskii CBS 2104 TaxID=1427455 RepID=A0A0A8L119_9SACH|nr:unnamed protein product [Kluyveromyces dobzhanskii CBS 2104]